MIHYLFAIAKGLFRNRFEKANQIEIGCSIDGFEHVRRMAVVIEPDNDSRARAPANYFASDPPCQVVAVGERPKLFF